MPIAVFLLRKYVDCLNGDMLKGGRLLGEKYAAAEIAKQSNEFEQHKLDRLVVLVIAIESLSGKCREPKPNL
jgi:hypothetical protein